MMNAQSNQQAIVTPLNFFRIFHFLPRDIYATQLHSAAGVNIPKSPEAFGAQKHHPCCRHAGTCSLN